MTAVPSKTVFALNSRMSGAAILSRPRPKLERGGPPEKPPNKPKSGDYCIKASAFIYNDDDKATVANIEGYDVDMNIVEIVSQVCDRNARNMYGNMKCSECKVVILPNIGSQMICEGIFIKQVEKEEVK